MSVALRGLEASNLFWTCQGLGKVTGSAWILGPVSSSFDACLGVS